MVASVSQIERRAGKARAATPASGQRQPTASKIGAIQMADEQKKVQVQKAALIPVTCAIPAQFIDRMVDGNLHEFIAVFPGPTFPEKGATVKDVNKALSLWSDTVSAIAEGAIVQLMDGETVLKEITPSDKIGAETERKEITEEKEQPDGSKKKVGTGVYAVRHGSLFLRTLPVEADEMGTTFIAGLKSKVGTLGRSSALDQFGEKQKRGRGGAEVDVDAI